METFLMTSESVWPRKHNNFMRYKVGKVGTYRNRWLNEKQTPFPQCQSSSMDASQVWRFPFPSAGITWSYEAIALIQGILLDSFACYRPGFRWVWCSFFHQHPHAGGCTSATISLTGSHWEQCTRVSRRSRWLQQQLRAVQQSCLRQPMSLLCPAACATTVWGTHSPPPAGCSCSHFLSLFFQIRCLFSSSAKNKWTARSDISTNTAPRLLRQPYEHGFQTKQGLRLFKDNPWIPPSIHPWLVQK